MDKEQNFKYLDEVHTQGFKLYTKKINAPQSISRAMKISELIDFKPRYFDSRFKDWENNGLIVIDDLFDGETLKSFNHLQGKFGLISTDFYRFLQLRSYLTSHKEWQSLTLQPSDLELFFIKIIKKGDGKNFFYHIYINYYRQL